MKYSVGLCINGSFALVVLLSDALMLTVFIECGSLIRLAAEGVVLSVLCVCVCVPVGVWCNGGVWWW